MQEKESQPSWKNGDQTLLGDEGMTCLKELAKIYMKNWGHHKVRSKNYNRYSNDLVKGNLT